MDAMVEQITGKTECLCDIAVLVRVWIRPELQQRQFECIRRARPSMLFIQSDGGRSDEEWTLISENRALFEGVDWNCTIHRMYFDKNEGLYGAGHQAISYLWSHVDRAVLLEDDIMFSDTFIPWCAEMLERYEEDERVFWICGMNHEGVSVEVDSDYFFSREASIWGGATWRRTFTNRGCDYASSAYVMRCIAENSRFNPNMKKQLYGYAQDERYLGHVAWSEFWNKFAVFGQNQLYVVPKRNMISNVGCTVDSAHSDDLRCIPKGLQRVFNMNTYDIPLPSHGPVCMVPDVRYQKSVYRIMGTGHPLVNAWRKASRAMRILRYSGANSLVRKIKSTRNRIEK